MVPPPTVTITTPAEGAEFAQNSVVAARFSCAAGEGGTLLAGTAGCSGTVANGAPIATGALGPQSFTVTATDALGQSTTVTTHYDVFMPA